MENEVRPSRGGVAFLLAPGPFGGAENIALYGCKAMGARLWVIQEKRKPAPAKYFLQKARQEGLAVKVFRCSSRFDLKTLQALNEAAKSEKIKIVHAHGMKANFYCSLMPVKRIGTQHGKTSHDLKVKWLQKIEDLSFARMNGLICVSEEQYRFYRHKNKAHIENFLRTPPAKNEYRESGKVELLFVGRLAREKGLAELIAALKDLPEARLTVIGEGSERKSLEKDINKPNEPTTQIRWLGFQENTLPFYAKADALIMPSHREGLPLTALEAAAAGLPILASSVGALPKVVKNNGILFEPQDPKAIVAAVRRFIAKRREINEAAKTEREHFIQNYSAQRWVEKVKEVYVRA